jgi:hypothetical protein
MLIKYKLTNELKMSILSKKIKNRKNNNFILVKDVHLWLNKIEKILHCLLYLKIISKIIKISVQYISPFQYLLMTIENTQFSKYPYFIKHSLFYNDEKIVQTRK